MRDVRTNVFMKRGKLVKGHRGIGVMLNMIWHVPGQKPYGPISQGGSRVFQHRRHIRATRMFCQQIAAQERRAEQDR
jgi:hypothetical protein